MNIGGDSCLVFGRICNPAAMNISIFNAIIRLKKPRYGRQNDWKDFKKMMSVATLTKVSHNPSANRAIRCLHGLSRNSYVPLTTL